MRASFSMRAWERLLTSSEVQAKWKNSNTWTAKAEAEAADADKKVPTTSYCWRVDGHLRREDFASATERLLSVWMTCTGSVSLKVCKHNQAEQTALCCLSALTHLADLGVSSKRLLEEVLHGLHVVVGGGLDALHLPRVLLCEVSHEGLQGGNGRGGEGRNLGDLRHGGQVDEPPDLRQREGQGSGEGCGAYCSTE